MRPLIGLNVCLGEMAAPFKARAFCHLAYIDAVVAGGGIPIIIPPYTDRTLLEEALAPLHGFCLIGGPDYDPAHFGGHPQAPKELMHPRRHTFDLWLMAWLLKKRLPTLGICGGHQLLSIALGGALVQDLKKEWVNHGQNAHATKVLLHAGDYRKAAQKDAFRHEVKLAPGSLIARIIGGKKVSANSYHHQAVQPDRVGEGLIATAWTEDGVIEVLEPARKKHFLLGVQWHPERQSGEPRQLAIFQALVEESKIKSPSIAPS